MLCFAFLVVFNSFFTIPVETENPRLKLALTIPTCTLIVVANDTVEMLPVVTYQNSQKSNIFTKYFAH